jgi:hypothetical protein
MVRADAKGESRFYFFRKGTIAFLLVTATVSFYEAIFVVNYPGSPYVALLGIAGALKIFVAVLCWRGRTRAFLTASIVALVGSTIDVLAGNDYALALFVAPQILVMIFGVMAYRERLSVLRVWNLISVSSKQRR